MAQRNEANARAAAAAANELPDGFEPYDDEDIEQLVSVFEQHRSLGTIVRDNNDMIRIEYLYSLRRFQRVDERVYRLIVDPGVITSLPDFMRHLSNILGYFINLAKMQSTSANDYARLYFQRAPVTPFSTKVIPVSEMTVERLLNNFSKAMQSNLEKIMNEGWTTEVLVVVLPPGLLRLPRAPRRRARQQRGGGGGIYAQHVNNVDDDDVGSAKSCKAACRKGREGKFVRGCIPFTVGL